jgi:PAS domain S-box-containing protein
MSATSHHVILSYLIAAAGVLVAGLSPWWLSPLINNSPPMRLILVAVVTCTAWLGGKGPGLFATTAGLCAIVVADDIPGDATSLLTRLWRFGSLALLITVLFEGMHAQRRRVALKEQEYLRSEGRYRHLIETAGEGIWALDRDGRTVYANPRLGEILGVPPDRLVGRPLVDFLVDAGSDPRNWRDPSEGTPVWHEVRLRGSGGAVRDAVATARPIGPDDALGGGGRRTGPAESGGLLVIVTDVTLLKRAERALREKESLLRSFYESSAMAMGVVELFEDGARLVSANALTDRFFGLAPGTLEGMMAKDLTAPSERLAVWIERFRKCRATGQPVRYECRNLWPTCPKWVAITLSAMDTPGSAGDLCSFIIEDITALKRTEEDLRVAKEVAEAASRAKDRFLAVLSHELRTPLTPTLIAVSSMIESKPDPALLPALEMIRRNIELEARLIDDLLDLSRIVRGRLRLDPEVVDVHQVIRRAVEICRDEVLVAGLVVLTELKARYHHVMADHARILQVTWNLIHNAVKFTPPDGRLTIRTINAPGPAEPAKPPGESPPPHLIVEFEDTGIGIAPEVLVRIFDAFEQGHDDMRGRSRGLGLGLAISRSLAKVMGGRLTATSAGSGLGSTFRLELTTVPAPAVTTATGRGTTRLAAPPAAPRGSPLRILLVEDNADTLKFLATVLRRRGHEVVTADCLAAARAVVDGPKARFDLLLSDVELPDGNGLELMRELAARKNWLGIAMSGFGTEEDLQLSRAAGFFDHLTKPIDLNQLDDAIHRATTQGRESTEESEPFRSRMKGTDSGEFELARPIVDETLG